MKQDYRIVLEICQLGQWRTLGEKQIRTKSLNSAKAQATNFCFRFPEMRYFWGKLDSGWFKSVYHNGDGLLFVSRKHHDCRGKAAVLRVEWQDPQLKLYADDIKDLRIHESWVKFRLVKELSNLLRPNERSSQC